MVLAEPGPSNSPKGMRGGWWLLTVRFPFLLVLHLVFPSSFSDDLTCCTNYFASHEAFLLLQI